VQRWRPRDEGVDESADVRGEKVALRIDDGDVVLRFHNASEYLYEHSALKEFRDQESRKQRDPQPINGRFPK
jgi:hypothetical protein